MNERSYGAQRASVELTNICNLHCGYCLRDEDALYHSESRFFPIPLLQKIAQQGRDAVGITHISFTGGEPTLHPHFAEAIATIAREGLTTSFVTNGWHFDRVWPAIAAHRDAVTHVSFSLDGATLEAHDKWRGQGSFVRLVSAFSRCRHYQFPFEIKTVVRKDTLPQLEQLAVFAARMGADALNLGHLLPTSDQSDNELALTVPERTNAEQEIALLARIFKMPIRLDVGYYNIDPVAPCSPLAGRSCNIDYRGRLSLCCNLSGFRGEVDQPDVVADLNEEPFAPAFARLQHVAELQMMRRASALHSHAELNTKPGLEVGSPCLYCLETFHKVPWQSSTTPAARSLPVITTVA
jgi:sulfatase maturation enzyme AslB (radical SAM superfamily)